jgi:hypothetical protein
VPTVNSIITFTRLDYQSLAGDAENQAFRASFIGLMATNAGVPFEAVTVFSIQAGPAVVTSAVVFPPGVAGLARSAMFDARLRYDVRSVFTSHPELDSYIAVYGLLTSTGSVVMAPPPSSPPKALPPSPPMPPPPLYPPIAVTLLPLAYDDYAEMDEAEDTAAPVIRLLGDPSAEVAQRGVYADAGAVAEDPGNGFLPVRVFGLEAIDTSLPSAAPFRVTYTASDAAGNRAAPVHRSVTVVSLCAHPSYVCPGASPCAVCEGAACLCLDDASGESQEPPRVGSFEVVPDLTPPVIRMRLGDDGLYGRVEGVEFVFHVVRQGSVFRDPGASAFDAEDGDVTHSVAAFGAGAVDTRVVTADSAPFVVTYSAVRISEKPPACENPPALLSSLQFGDGGVRV